LSDTSNKSDAQAVHEDLRRFIAHANEAAVSLSISTVKGLLLINGGAAVAMLGFVATTSSHQAGVRLDLGAMTGALMWFAWGVAASVLSSGLAYVVMYLQAAYAQSFDLLTEYPYFTSGKGTKALGYTTNSFHIVAVVVALAALLCFVLGTYEVSNLVANGAK
jgi:hypothetical protein